MKPTFEVRDNVCVLCQCTPLDGDLCFVVFGTHAYEGQIDSFKYPHCGYPASINPQRYSDRLKLDQLRYFLFHVECLNVLYTCAGKHSMAKLWRLGSVLSPFALPQSTSHRRRREHYLAETLLKFDDETFTRECFQECLRCSRDGLNLLFRLPREIQCRIAREAFPCAYTSLAITLTTVTLLKRLGNPPMPSMERFQVLPTIDQRLIELPDASYVASITSGQSGVVSQRRRGLEKIRVGMDCHGVQNVELDWSDSYRLPSPWYEFLGDDGEEPVRELVGVFNGLLLQRILIPPTQEPLPCQTLWDSPSLPPDAFLFTGRKRFNDRRLMTCVPLDGGPLGLTMLCRGSSNVRLLLHKDAGSPTLDEYCDLDRAEQDSTVRVYFALHPDEKVTGAWVRVRRNFKDHYAQPVLKIETSRQRSCTFGPYILPGSVSHEFVALTDPAAGTVCAIYHGILQKADPRCILDFVAACARPNHPKPTYSPAAGEINPPSMHSIMPLYLSRASLSHLCLVEICKVLNPYPRCVGLLFHYDDGSREALAQYRWDEAESHDIRHCASVSFSWRIDSSGSHYLADIFFGGPAAGRPLEGELVWWYNWKEDYICIDGHDVSGTNE